MQLQNEHKKFGLLEIYVCTRCLLYFHLQSQKEAAEAHKKHATAKRTAEAGGEEEAGEGGASWAESDVCDYKIYIYIYRHESSSREISGGKSTTWRWKINFNWFTIHFCSEKLENVTSRQAAREESSSRSSACSNLSTRAEVEVSAVQYPWSGSAGRRRWAKLNSVDCLRQRRQRELGKAQWALLNFSLDFAYLIKHLLISNLV